MASRAHRAAPISVPGSMVPVSSMVTCAWMGRCRPAALMARRAPLMAALAWSRSKTVSTRIRSTPPSMRAAGLLLVGVAQVGVADLAEGRELGARADAARPPSGAGSGVEKSSAAARARCGRGQVELADPVGLPVLGQHRGEGPEGVGLDHVAADLEERPVDPVDDVRAG